MRRQLQLTYNPKAPYLPILKKFLCRKHCNSSCLQESQNSVPDSMDGALSQVHPSHHKKAEGISALWFTAKIERIYSAMLPSQLSAKIGGSPKLTVPSWFISAAVLTVRSIEIESPTVVLLTVPRAGAPVMKSNGNYQVRKFQ